MYSDKEKQIMLKSAFDSIAYGLKHNQIMHIDISNYSENLQKKRACFVTLHLKHQLRGCIGSLQIYQPLVKDVIHNAYNAAFLDPRFSSITRNDYEKLEINISILSKSEPMSFNSEENLIQQLRPNIDGLILTEQYHKSTFLPNVWESLQDPKEFLGHLKLKAGLLPNYWSNTIKFERYTTELIKGEAEKNIS